MGRVRLLLKKIENKTYRHITFAKRKNGLIKKAYELSTLCDVDVALIIFSPAGKLFLFDGKKRLEEIFMHYIDLPHHQRGRLSDQELVRRIIAQLSLETELCNQLVSYRNSDRESKISIDSQLEEIQKEIRMYSAELEDVEKQLQYFLKSPSSIKSASEAEFLEGILEDTLKLVRFHKKGPALHPQTAGSSNFIMGSLNNCQDNWPQQYDTSVLTTNNFSNSTGFHSLRNQSQPLAEMPSSSLPNLRDTGYLAGNIAVSSAGIEFDGCICQSEYDKIFNANFPQGFSYFSTTNQEERTSGNYEQNKVVDFTVASRRSCSHFLDCGIPFP